MKANNGRLITWEIETSKIQGGSVNSAQNFKHKYFLNHRLCLLDEKLRP